MYQLAPKIWKISFATLRQNIGERQVFIAIGIFVSTACGIYLFNVGPLYIDGKDIFKLAISDKIPNGISILDCELRSVYGNIININSKGFAQNEIYSAMVNLSKLNMANSLAILWICLSAWGKHHDARSICSMESDGGASSRL